MICEHCGGTIFSFGSAMTYCKTCWASVGYTTDKFMSWGYDDGRKEIQHKECADGVCLVVKNDSL